MHYIDITTFKVIGLYCYLIDMNPSQAIKELDHHVHTSILIEHLDTKYLFRDIGIRNSLIKFAEEYKEARTPNKFWVSRSGEAFVASVILSVTRAVVDDSKERVAKKGRHGPGFYSAHQQALEELAASDGSESDVEWVPVKVANSIDTEAVKAANALLVSLKRKPTEELQADVDAINKQIADAQKKKLRRA